jgi:hypothetical protein
MTVLATKELNVTTYLIVVEKGNIPKAAPAQEV